MTVSARPLAHNTGASAHNRLLQPTLSPAPELDLSATHPSRSPLQQSIHGENTELGSVSWMPSENGSICGEPASVYLAGSCNQQPVSTYATLPLSRPVQMQWKIPSIHEVLRGAEVGGDIPFVPRSNGE
jgi:hypothetical protein